MRQSSALRPLDLLSVARALVEVEKHRPSAAFLRRAASTTYYAMFHCLAETSADLLAGSDRSSRRAEAWRQVYRSLNHNDIRTRCQATDKLKRFSIPVQTFMTTTLEFQDKRHEADYNPHQRFVKSEVVSDIDRADRAIKDFNAVDRAERLACCLWLLFEKRGR